MKYVNDALKKVLCESCRTKINAENMFFTIDSEMCKACTDLGDTNEVKTIILASVLKELVLRFFVERKIAKTYASESEFHQIFEKAFSNLKSELTWTDVLAEEFRMDPEMQDVCDNRN